MTVYKKSYGNVYFSANYTRPTDNRIVQRYRHSEQFKDLPRSTWPRVTARAGDRYVTNVVARNRFVTGPEVRSPLYAARGPGARPFSVKTFRNRIPAGGFKSMVLVKKPELTQRNKDARIAFGRAHARWNNLQWRRVIMFSDESRFLSTESGRQKTSLAAAPRTACSSYSDT